MRGWSRALQFTSRSRLEPRAPLCIAIGCRRGARRSAAHGDAEHRPRVTHAGSRRAGSLPSHGVLEQLAEDAYLAGARGALFLGSVAIQLDGEAEVELDELGAAA